MNTRRLLSLPLGRILLLHYKGWMISAKNENMSIVVWLLRTCLSIILCLSIKFSRLFVLIHELLLCVGFFLLGMILKKMIFEFFKLNLVLAPKFCYFIKFLSTIFSAVHFLTTVTLDMPFVG